MMDRNNLRLLAIFAAIVGAAALRLAPHPPNFTPIGAMALFGGAYADRRWLAFIVPLGALLVSDMVIGFHALMPFVYGSVAVIVLLGRVALKRRSPLRIGLTAVAGSVVFYLVTNFGVWLQLGTYPHTPAGLLACYVAAIPYFQNTLAGDLFYNGLLFGGFALLERSVPALRDGRRPQAA